MANIYDYIKQYGDKTFTEEPFNDVDNLVFSQLIYIDFEGIVGGFISDKKTLLSKSAKKFYEIKTQDEINNSISIVQRAVELLFLCAKTKRYGGVKLSKYVNSVNEKIDKQFCAMNFFLDDNTVLIAFRGTDTSLTGVKESAMLSYMFPVPAQIEALYYFQETASLADCPVRVCGHSKGGNLAVFAGVACSNSLRRKIIAIYEDDAPGFPYEFINRYDYIEIKDRIISFIPERSIIGCMLEHSENIRVVKSDNENLKQHQVSSWIVVDKSFEFLVERDDVSKFIEKYFKLLMLDLGPENMASFFETCFTFFEDSGINNYYDLKNIDTIKFFKTIAQITDISEDDKSLVISTLKLAVKDFSKLFYQKRIKTLLKAPLRDKNISE